MSFVSCCVFNEFVSLVVVVCVVGLGFVSFFVIVVCFVVYLSVSVCFVDCVLL